METKRVCIIEDDEEITALLKIHLEDLEYEIVSYLDGKEGYDAVLASPPDLLILDIRLPHMDGLEICKNLRANNVDTPILMLTARSEEIDKVLGLEIGADDYMSKPFSIREFIARVKALFRRSSINQKTDTEKVNGLLDYGQLKIDIEMRKVTLDDKRVDLSPKEFELLSLLASNPGKSYKRSRLLNLIWGYDFEGYEHTVNSHINRLRVKIEPDMENPKYILTSWGVGYKFNEEI